MDEPIRRRSESHVEGLMYDRKIHDYISELENHFLEQEDRRSLIIVRSSKRQLELMLQIASGDIAAIAVLQSEFPAREYPGEGMPYPDSDYLTMDKSGETIDMRPITKNMSFPDSDPYIVAGHFSIITGDRYTGKRIDNPLAAVMDELLDDGLRELGWKAAEIHRNICGIKNQCESAFFMNLPKDIISQAHPLSGDPATAKLNEMINGFREAIGFGVGQPNLRV